MLVTPGQFEVVLIIKCKENNETLCGNFQLFLAQSNVYLFTKPITPCSAMKLHRYSVFSSGPLDFKIFAKLQLSPRSESKYKWAFCFHFSLKPPPRFSPEEISLELETKEYAETLCNSNPTIWKKWMLWQSPHRRRRYCRNKGGHTVGCWEHNGRNMWAKRISF